MSVEAPSFGLWYDLRNPARWRQPTGPLYRDSVDQAVWAEGLGFGSAWFSEHHFADDDYLSSPLLLAGAVGTRTTRMRVGTNVVVAALHHPVRLAEDSTALALLTGDRFDLGVALGYHEREFAAFGQRVRQRPSLLEDAIEVVRRAWTPGREPHHGKRFSSPDLPVTPAPENPPRLLVGAQSPVGIDRAARMGDGVITLSNQHFDHYLEALSRHGRPVEDARIYASQWAIVADDPERVWARIGEKALYQINAYIEWGSFEGPDQPSSFPNPQALLDAGVYRLMDADIAVGQLVDLVTRYPQVRDVHYWAQLPGETVESGSERVEYIAGRVIPAVTAALNEPQRAGV